MAHGIYSNSDYASTQREWHGLGTLMLPGESLENWIERSGMGFKIGRAKVRYATRRMDEAIDTVSALNALDDKVVLFRMDTGAPLGVVSDGYKVVQPAQVWEFFREWATANGLTLESGGVLFGGKRYFATAKLAEGSELALDGETGKDIIKRYVLLSTSADGSLATEGGWKYTRTVCNNTLNAARSECKAEFRITHRSVFKPEEAKKVIETANAEFGAFMETARMLAGVKVTSKQAEDLYIKLLVTATRDADKVKESAAFQKMLALFNGAGKGAMLETSRETAWGWLNATTEYVDHYSRTRSEENRLVSAMWGPGDDLKTRALELVTVGN